MSASRRARWPPGFPGALELIVEGKAIPHCELRVVGDADEALPERTVGHIQIRGENVTSGYFEAPEINAASFTTDGWLRTGDLGLLDEGELVVTGRAKEIIFVNGQNYYPHDIETIAEAAPGLELGKVAAAGCRPADAETDELVLFVLHRGNLGDFVPLAAEVTRRVNEHAGLEVAHVVPVKRIPKTTMARSSAWPSRRPSWRAISTRTCGSSLGCRKRPMRITQDAAGSVEKRIKAIVDDALPGKRVEVDDNLFEIGASSLTLIQCTSRSTGLSRGWWTSPSCSTTRRVSELARDIESKLPSRDG